MGFHRLAIRYLRVREATFGVRHGHLGCRTGGDLARRLLNQQAGMSACRTSLEACVTARKMSANDAGRLLYIRALFSRCGCVKPPLSELLQFPFSVSRAIR